MRDGLTYLPLLLPAAILLVLAVYGFTLRKTPSSMPFSLAMLLSAIWSVLYLLQMGSTDLSAKIVFEKLRVLAMAPLPVVWLVFAFSYTGRTSWLSPARIAGFLIEPTAAIVLAALSGSSTLFRYDYHLDPSRATGILLFTNGTLFPIHLFYAYGLFAVASFIIVSSSRGWQPIFKTQAWMCFIGVALPVAASALFQLGIISWNGISPTPMILAISGLLAAVAFFRFRFLDVQPVAGSLLLQTLDDMMLVVDVKGRLIDFNPRARTTMGFDPRHTVGKTLDVLPAPWNSHLGPPEGTEGRGHFDIEGKNGARSYDLTVTPIRDHLGRTRGRLLLFHDVTERRIVEEAVETSRERLQLVFDSASDGMWDWEVPTGKMYWSPRFYRMLGYTPGEIEAGFESWKDLLNPDDRAAALAEIDGMLENPRERNSLEIRMRARDGGWRWVLSRSRVVKRDVDGRALRVVGTHVDITERREAEERLRESEEKFRSFIEQSAESIMLIDEKGGVIEYNPAAERLTGFPRREVIGMPIWEIMGRLISPEKQDPDYTLALRERFGGVFTQGKADFLNRLLESKLVRPDGSVRYFQQYLFPIGTASGWRIGSISHDITEAKKAAEALAKSNEQLQQAQKMEAVGRLAGGIAHDFNNLLTVISGYCDLVLGRLPDDNPLKADVSEIMTAADRATTLTSQLLAFSRKQVLQPRTINVNELVRDMGKMLRRVIGEDIELATSFDSGTGNIAADPGQIEQVIMNLAVNARDAMPEGGRLTIETSNVLLDQGYCRHHPGVNPGEYVKIVVSDTGRGMDAEIRSRIFEPFFTTKERGKGTGLGLPTAYGIITQSGGHILCDSQPGAGTTFTIHFPRSFTEAVASRSSEPDPAVVPGDETVLLVEDEDSVRGFTATVLRKSGYIVLEASHGTEAIAAISTRGCRLQLLITDVVMPGMSGQELAQKVIERCGAVKILYISGYTEDAIVHHGILEQGIDFIQKPFNSQRLLRKVREILDRP
jgi:two-component system cell cycle sensor histidine kinase/response regulator CckA